jgi:hypothetical protein
MTVGNDIQMGRTNLTCMAACYKQTCSNVNSETFTPDVWHFGTLKRITPTTRAFNVCLLFLFSNYLYISADFSRNVCRTHFGRFFVTLLGSYAAIVLVTPCTWPPLKSLYSSS